MKKLVLLILLVCTRQINAQTWVTIPDPNFVTYLQSIIPSAMNGNQMDTSNTLVTTTTKKINVSFKNISNLSGVQYFSSLDTLLCNNNAALTILPNLSNSIAHFNCSHCSLSNLPVLPSSLINLSCNNNPALTILPNLSDSIVYLNCGHCALSNLPVLPSKLIDLYCRNNSLTNLPILSNSLYVLDCDSNALIGLPALPSSLSSLSCASNFLTNLPSLPNDLTALLCTNNSLTSLPNLPPWLLSLVCKNNPHLTLLPTLPNYLTNLQCDYDSLTSLPALNNELSFLTCTHNFLTSFPAINPSLQGLSCDYNSLTSLPTLDNALTILNCSHNLLTSLPALDTSLSNLECSYNSLTSLPNLPRSLYNLNCNNNFLTSLPTLTSNTLLHTLQCNNNNITCFPTFPNSIYPSYYSSSTHQYVYSINISNNPFTCLPNYLPVAMDSATLAYPVCIAGNPNGCPDASSCAPMVNFTLQQDTVAHTWDAYPNYSGGVPPYTYYWSWGDGSYSTSAYPSYSYSSPGWYNICAAIQDVNGCASTYYCLNDSLYKMSSSMVTVNVVNNSSGIKRNMDNTNHISVYPNPTSDQFTIETNGNNMLTVDLYDVNGRHLVSKNVSAKENINVTTLNEGVYTLTIKAADLILNKKLIILH